MQCNAILDTVPFKQLIGVTYTACGGIVSKAGSGWQPLPKGCFNLSKSGRRTKEKAGDFK
jgi:hypothetical protein